MKVDWVATGTGHLPERFQKVWIVNHDGSVGTDMLSVDTYHGWLCWGAGRGWHPKDEYAPTHWAPYEVPLAPAGHPGQFAKCEQ